MYFKAFMIALVLCIQTLALSGMPHEECFDDAKLWQKMNRGNKLDTENCAILIKFITVVL
jgi:hypothetical protein